MTVRERVVASRLIERFDEHGEYARRIGLSCVLAAAKTDVIADKAVQKKEEKINNKKRQEIYNECPCYFFKSCLRFFVFCR